MREPFESLNILPGVAWLEPSDVSDAVIFLCSDAAKFITGVALPIDAGNIVNGRRAASPPPRTRARAPSRARAASPPPRTRARAPKTSHSAGAPRRVSSHRCHTERICIRLAGGGEC